MPTLLITLKKSLLACKTKGVKRLVVGGGVAANNRLRDKFNEVLIFIMMKEYCPLIPKEVQNQKKDLFYYISPIIAFLILFWINSDNLCFYVS